MKCVLPIVLLGLCLRSLLLIYGLPDRERVDIYFNGQAISEVAAEKLNLYRVLNSHYVDEFDILAGIASMKPRQFDFNPKIYFWGHTHFYAIAAALAAGQIVDFVEKPGEKRQLFEQPEKMARLYLTGRILNLLLSLAAIVILFLLVKAVWGEREALFSALLLAVLPAHIILSTVLAFDAPMVTWALLSGLLLIHFVRSGRRIWLIAGSVACGLAMGTKYHGVFLLPALFYLLLQDRNRKGFLNIVILLGVTGLAFSITNPYLILKLSELLEVLWGHSILSREVTTAQASSNYSLSIIKRAIFRTPHKITMSFGWPHGFLFLILAGIGVFIGKRKSLLFLLAALPVLFLDAGFRANVLRYFLLPISFLIPLCAYAHVRLMEKRRWLGVFGWILVVGCLLTDIWVLSLSMRPEPSYAVAKWVHENVSKQSTLAVFHRMYFSPPIDWDQYAATTSVRSDPEKTLDADYVVWPAFREFLWMLGGSFSDNYEKIASFPQNEERIIQLRQRDIGEFQLIHTPYWIYRRKDMSLGEVR